jgi:hypothetical protein
MKSARFILFPAALCILAGFVGCDETKGPAGKAGDKIDDVLDQRPGEEVRDAVEEATR